MVEQTEKKPDIPVGWGDVIGMMLWSIVLTATLTLFLSHGLAQEKSPKGTPGVIQVDATSITATVEAIDYDKRTIALNGPKGHVLVTKVGPEVKNFKQIKTGDKVTVEYYEATAIYVRTPNEPPFAQESSAVQVAATGARPGVVAIDTVETRARVENIDSNKRQITLRGPQQKTAKLDVHESVKRFSEIKKGEEIVVQHTEALAFNVQPAK